MKKILTLLSFFALSSLSSAALKVPEKLEENSKKVIIFSATYCPNCRHVKRFLTAQNIPYKEFDIEKSVAARRYFDKLGGRGTPFLIINNHLLPGFNPTDFWRHYKDLRPIPTFKVYE